MNRNTSNVPRHQLVADYLRLRAGERLTPESIARGLAESHPDLFVEKQRGLGSHAKLIEQLTREIYRGRHTVLQKYPDVAEDISRRPLRLFVEDVDTGSPPATQLGVEDERSDTNPSQDLPDAERSDEEGERGLYKPLQIFLLEEGIVSKRIRESTSRNRRGRNGNRWLHPDIVGMLAPGQSWEEIVRQCSMALPTRKAKLVAVEVKLRLTAGDVRECFFQTVSNSLWANRAYLAAVEVKGKDTRDELETLCALHGVGYISIDPKQPSESRIAIPARERDEVDWASVNRIAEENDDFRNYLSDVLNYLQTGKVVHRLWDNASG